MVMGVWWWLEVVGHPWGTLEVGCVEVVVVSVMVVVVIVNILRMRTSCMLFNLVVQQNKTMGGGRTHQLQLPESRMWCK